MILIDGHNLLWAIEGSRPGAQCLSDTGMCRIIGRYLKQIGDAGEIVFDGTGPPDKSDFERIDSVEVFFAGAATDADGVIEDKIKASTTPRRLVVVSSDRRIRRAARVRKATAVKSEAFWADLQKQLRRKPAKREPSAKEIGLTETETDQWLKAFGLDQ